MGAEQEVGEDPGLEKLGVRVKGEAVVIGCVRDPSTRLDIRLVAYRLGRPTGEEGSDLCIDKVSEEGPAALGVTCTAIREQLDDHEVLGGGDVDLKLPGTVDQPGKGRVEVNAEGAVSGRVEGLRVHYKDLDGRKATTDATLVRVTDDALLSRLELDEPFGRYLVAVDGTRITALEPLGPGGRSLGKESYDDLLRELTGEPEKAAED